VTIDYLLLIVQFFW